MPSRSKTATSIERRPPTSSRCSSASPAGRPSFHSKSSNGYLVVALQELYVECEFSERTARTIRGLRTWVTNEYDHNGLRAKGDEILDRLLALARGR